MANLAGFDVVAEVSADTLRDMLNQQPQTLAGPPIFLLGGPFQIALPVTLPTYGAVQVQMICTAALDAVPQTPNCTITCALSDGSATSASFNIFHMGGTASLTVAVGFVPNNLANAPSNSIVPAVLLASVIAKVAFDAPTVSKIGSVIGATM